MSRSTVLKIITALLIFLAISGVILSIYILKSRNGQEIHTSDATSTPSPAATADGTTEPTDSGNETPEVSITPIEPTPPEVTATTDEPIVSEPPLPPEPPSFEPYAVDGTEPDRMLSSTGIMADGKIVESYTFPEPIDFGFGEDYASFEGIATFRGNNFRDSASYGTADIINAKFGDKWSRNTGSYSAPDGAFWSGNGWSGQPLIEKWSKHTREIMNMYDWAKEQEELVEVIYPSMDGNVYFSELETGKATRDKLYLGFPFKGAGAIDPRGYPLLYVGAGYAGTKGAARILIVSLIDGSVLYTFGNGDSFAPRGWTAADGASLISAETDQLINPSENGTIYIIKLNSVYDPENGTIAIDPAPVKWRFRGKRSLSGGKYWLGMETSPVIWRGHLIIADNGGHLICLDLNTLEPVWVQDTLDDTNCSPVLELEDGHPYVYISTSFHGGWRAPMSSKTVIPIWKIDAVTGEKVWQADYDCYTLDGVSGGVLGTAAIGKKGLDELVFVPVARTPTRGEGILTALNKRTGEVIWEFKSSQYAWSSPVCVYDKDDKGYVIYCTSSGNMHLLDGLTGELLDTVQLGGNIEASPAVYENTIVVGTRTMQIWGITLT